MGLTVSVLTYPTQYTAWGRETGERERERERERGGGGVGREKGREDTSCTHLREDRECE